PTIAVGPLAASAATSARAGRAACGWVSALYSVLPPRRLSKVSMRRAIIRPILHRPADRHTGAGSGRRQDRPARLADNKRERAEADAQTRQRARRQHCDKGAHYAVAEILRADDHSASGPNRGQAPGKPPVPR